MNKMAFCWRQATACLNHNHAELHRTHTLSDLEESVNVDYSVASMSKISMNEYSFHRNAPIYIISKSQSIHSIYPCVHYILIAFPLHILSHESPFLVLVCYVNFSVFISCGLDIVSSRDYHLYVFVIYRTVCVQLTHSSIRPNGDLPFQQESLKWYI